MVQMEKLQMHRVQQDLLGHKEPLVQLALPDLQDLRVQQDQRVQVQERPDRLAQRVHQVLREVLDQLGLQDQLVQQAAQVQLDRQELKVKQEQQVLRELQKLKW
jgi:Flp pilus assembly CpaF family ATPase